MVYYLGSEADAPLTPPSEADAFYVSKPSDDEMAVRRNLPLPCIRYLGSRKGCGCGFRRERGGEIEIDSDPEEARATQADHDALVAYLRMLPQQARPMQIYGCWSGEEGKPPEYFRSCSIEALAAPDFGFRERELITLVG